MLNVQNIIKLNLPRIYAQLSAWNWSKSTEGWIELYSVIENTLSLNKRNKFLRYVHRKEAQNEGSSVQDLMCICGLLKTDD